ncbi:MAG: membrane protein insertion efficiency factor YidD [Myxococcales bacterium]|nr:membrane protein insertion efficiency factor YidD [Myxococcales bacterium]
MTLYRTIHQLLVTIVLMPVRFYRRVLSPMKRAPSCIYLPTCSEYAIVAVQRRGIVLGSAMAIGRILRCNPLFHGGYHPVSDPASHRCAHHAQEQH